MSVEEPGAPVSTDPAPAIPIDLASLRSAGFLVVDEVVLRSIMQTAVLDAHEEAKLRYEAQVMADRSAEHEIERLRIRANDAESQVARSKVWWRRLVVPASALGLIAGATALAFTFYMIREAKGAMRQDTDALSKATAVEMTRIATDAASAAVAASELRTDARITAIDMEIKSIRTDVKTEIRGLKEDLVREIRGEPVQP